jgi:hypothetical protein
MNTQQRFTPAPPFIQQEWDVIARKMDEPAYSQTSGIAQIIDGILLDGATEAQCAKHRTALLAFIDGLHPENPAEELLATNAALFHLLTLQAARDLIRGHDDRAAQSRGRRDFIALSRAGAEMLRALQAVGADIRVRGEAHRRRNARPAVANDATLATIEAPAENARPKTASAAPMPSAPAVKIGAARGIPAPAPASGRPARVVRKSAAASPEMGQETIDDLPGLRRCVAAEDQLHIDDGQTEPSKRPRARIDQRQGPASVRLGVDEPVQSGIERHIGDTGQQPMKLRRREAHLIAEARGERRVFRQPPATGGQIATTSPSESRVVARRAGGTNTPFSTRSLTCAAGRPNGATSESTVAPSSTSSGMAWSLRNASGRKSVSDA